MLVCFPVEKNNGLESTVYGHFGSAPIFVIADTETNTLREIGNQNLNHEHSKCNPVQALNGEKVDAIILGGIGGGALTKLQAMNIDVFKATAPTIKENMELLKENKLLPMTSTCSGHSHGGGCGH